MDLPAGTRLGDVPVDMVFVGSCTNGRLDDLRAVAEVLRGRRVHETVRMLVVPGSFSVRQQAEREGLDEVFRAAGAEWRTAGCSMCVGMNGDSLARGQRCASTSNRNFEGRQGAGAYAPGVTARRRGDRGTRRVHRAGRPALAGRQQVEELRDGHRGEGVVVQAALDDGGRVAVREPGGHVLPELLLEQR